jgi:EpsI family protein
MRNGVAFLPAGLLGAGWLVLALAGNPTPVPLGHDLAALPTTVGVLRAAEGGVPEVMLPYEGSRRFARVYGAGGAEALLVVEYFPMSAGTAALRSPLLPLRNGGWSLGAASVQPAAAGADSVRLWRAEGRKGTDAVVAYHWVQRRGVVSANTREMRVALVRDALLRRRAEVASVLVLVQQSSTPGGAPASAAADSAARALVGAVIPALDRLLP